MPFFSNVNKPNITNAVNARVWAFQKLESFNFNLGNSQNAQKSEQLCSLFNQIKCPNRPMNQLHGLVVVLLGQLAPS